MVDSADKVLLPATFSALQIDLSVGPASLGALNFCQSLAFSLSLPLWGHMVSRWHAQEVLALGCYVWAVATALLALSFDFYVHAALRVLNGAALGAVMPTAQAVLCEIVPESKRGAAFGRLMACTHLAGMLTVTYALSVQGQVFKPLGESFPLRGWQMAYLQVAICSGFIGGLLQYTVPSGVDEKDKASMGPRGELGVGHFFSMVKMIVRIPSFGLLVFQGVTGGVPWNAMSFLTMYWQVLGFSNWQAGFLTGARDFGGMLGSLLGGKLGDMAALRSPDQGRCWVALTSVVLGLVLFVLMLEGLPQEASSFYACAFVLFSFGVCAPWAAPGANRPICAELVNSPGERAQIVATWMLLEGISSSIFGAPLVGWLSEHFGYRLSKENRSRGGDPASADSLARAMVGVAVINWALCALAWVAMLRTLPHDRHRARQQRVQASREPAEEGGQALKDLDS